jgi:hypothetical protein
VNEPPCTSRAKQLALPLLPEQARHRHEQRRVGSDAERVADAVAVDVRVPPREVDSVEHRVHALARRARRDHGPRHELRDGEHGVGAAHAPLRRPAVPVRPRDVDVHDRSRARQLPQADRVDGVARAIRAVHDPDAPAADVVPERSEIEREGRGGARLTQDRARAAVAEARREMRGPDAKLRDPLELRQRRRGPRPLPAGAREVHVEVVAIEVAHQVAVDRRVRPEAGLRVQEEDADLLGHQMSPAFRSSASRWLARAASAMAVSTGFFSGPVVNADESTTATLGTPWMRFQPSIIPKRGDACMRQDPP